MTVWLVLGPVFVTLAQGEEKAGREDRANFSVQWISQYPALNDRKDHRKGRDHGEKDEGKGEGTRSKSGKWLADLIFGKKNLDLVKPMSIVAVDTDLYWIADQGAGAIIRVEKGVGEITQSSKKADEKLPSLVGSCITRDNKILFTDSKLNQIFWFNPGGKELRVLNDSLVLQQPTGIGYSRVKDQVWVVETKAHRISILDELGNVIRRIGGRGNGPGQFNYPTFLWIDESGMVYVVDAMNYRVQIFDSEGEFISMFGKIGDASGYFTRPKGIATDSFGHVYIADALFHAVQVFDKDGNYLYAFGSMGDETEQLWMPAGIFIDAYNCIYIADSYNSRVQVFKLIGDN